MKWLTNTHRPERTGEVFRDQPLTFILTGLFSSACGFGLIYIFAFSDTAEERWQHFYVVFAFAAFLGACLALVKRREDKSPFPLGIRRAVWASILLAYAVAVVAILTMGFAPFSRLTDTVRLLCYLGSLAPAPLVAWSLLKSHR